MHSSCSDFNNLKASQMLKIQDYYSAFSAFVVTLAIVFVKSLFASTKQKAFVLKETFYIPL